MKTTAYLLLWFTQLPYAAEANKDIAGLGADSFQAREDAGKRLASMGVKAVPWLHDGCRNASPEIARRCERLLEDYAESRLQRWRPYPFIDSFWFDSRLSYGTDPGEVRHWLRLELEPYLEAVGRDGGPWENYRVATGDLFREWVLAGVPDGVMDRLVPWLRVRDEMWLARVGWKPEAR